MYYLPVILYSSWIFLVIEANDTMLTASKDIKIWSRCDTNGSCVCGNNDFGEVNCHDDTLDIKTCYCMYYDEVMEKTVIGNCMQTCFYRSTSYSIKRYSMENASLVNTAMCDWFAEISNNNREGHSVVGAKRVMD